MIEFLKSISFANPYAFWVLFSLPIIFWVIKSLPPSPASFNFSSLYLLRAIKTESIVKNKCPIWLLIFRILLIMFLIIYFAKPFLNHNKVEQAKENYVVYANLGWSTAAQWNKYKNTIKNIMLESEKLNKNFSLVNNFDNQNKNIIKFKSINDLSSYLDKVTPNPWQSQRKNIINELSKINYNNKTRYFYIFSVFDFYSDENFDENILINIQKQFPDLEIINLIDSIKVLEKPLVKKENINIIVKRYGALPENTFVITATSFDEQILLKKEYQFKKNENIIYINEKFPISVINQIKKIDILGERHAASTFYFDDFNKKKVIGILSDGKNYKENPLLSPVYYIKKALNKDNKIIINDLANLLLSNVDILIFPDAGTFEEEKSGILDSWINNGGLLIRFAGPKLASSSTRFITSENKIKKIRLLGGQLSWNNDLKIKEFSKDSIFKDLIIPKDVTIKKQLLLNFSEEKNINILASLKDDTPLVSLKEMGRGNILLFHFTANNTWSDIPITPLFEDFLSRACLLHQKKKNSSLNQVTIKSYINGFGEIEDTNKIVQFRDSLSLRNSIPSKDIFPGIYENNQLSVALNLSGNLRLNHFENKSSKQIITTNDFSKNLKDISKVFLYLFLGFALLDILASIFIQNDVKFYRFFKNKIKVFSVFTFLILSILPDDLIANDFINYTYLAYVKSIDKNKNESSFRGLQTLSKVLERRTSVLIKGVAGIDIEVDDVYHFPFIYWPMSNDFKNLSSKAKRKIKDYFNTGGVILFDGYLLLDKQPLNTYKLKKIVSYFKEITSNELVLINKNHTLSKSFYLLNNFPGRWNKKILLVDNSNMNVNDGVSNIILGFNDWASAWALDSNNYPLFPVVPGGEKQRELAYRVGINIVMYSLTGNYKNDQVHSKSILNRLKSGNQND